MRHILCPCKSLFRWIVDDFPQTSQITSEVLRLSFFFNNLHRDLRIAEIRVTMFVDSQIR